jgi:hypothetical protein
MFMAKCFLVFLACLVKEKLSIKFLLTSLKILINSKDCSGRRIKFWF